MVTIMFTFNNLVDYYNNHALFLGLTTFCLFSIFALLIRSARKDIRYSQNVSSFKELRKWFLIGLTTYTLINLALFSYSYYVPNQPQESPYKKTNNN